MSAGLTGTSKPDAVWLVYILKSQSHPTKTYIGLTTGPFGTTPDKRLHEHNTGGTAYTAKYRPWQLVSWLTFTDEAKARAFESYAKQGAGFRWVGTHLLPDAG